MEIKIKQITNLVPILTCQYFKDEIILVSSVTKLTFLLTTLKHHINYQYQILTCISGIDFLSKKYRFGVVYELLSLTYNNRIRIKIFINEITFVPSCLNLFINSNWWEREIWDLYGVYFENHLDLRRILTDYGFEGYPLRKDFPLSGYVELRYNEIKKRITVDIVELNQEFRLFSFETPW